MDTESTSIDISSLKLRALAPLEVSEQGSNFKLISSAHNALHQALSQHPQYGAANRARDLGNTQASTGLPSTVPESAQIFDAATIQSLLPEASTTVHLPRKMNSQGALEPTQELSPSYYEGLVSRRRSSTDSGDNETQHTLNEGDKGHIDLTSSFVPHEEDGQEEENAEHGDFPPTQSQRRFSQFPESQRFRTPATAGKKRDYNGNTRGSPDMPQAPVLRSDAPTPAHLMRLTQAFDATQAATSPFFDGAIDVHSDRPSPNLDVENRPTTATVSSPLRPISEFKRATTEPASRYISIAQSQAERNRKVQMQSLEQVDEDSDDDDFDEEPSMVKRQRRLREREERAKKAFQLVSSPTRLKPRGISVIKSSPTLAAQRSSPSPTRMPQLPVAQAAISQDAEPEDRDVQPSEAETEQEEEDVNVRRSSQTSPIDEEDKENYEGHIQIPETTARAHGAVDVLPSEIDASPSLRHGGFAGTSVVRPLASSGPIAVANSQPSQPVPRSQTLRQVPKSSSTSGPDFVPQSQAASGQQATSAAATPPPESPKAQSSLGRVQEVVAREDEDDIAQDFVAPQPEQASAPAQLVNTIPETDSLRLLQSEQPSRSTYSAPGANTVSIDVYETAPSRMPSASNLHGGMSELSSPPIVTTPPGRKRKRMSDISAEPSPQQRSTQGFDPTEALNMEADVHHFLDDSPIKPHTRPAKRRKLQAASVEIRETINTARENSLRQTGPGTSTPRRKNATLIDEANRLEQAEQNPAVDPPSLRNAPNSRASVWEMDVSPPHKCVPTRTAAQETPKPATQQSLKRKAPKSIAPEKPQTVKETRVTLRGQTQAEGFVHTQSESPSLTCYSFHGKVIAPNVVFACFNGRSRAYYPARCLGAIEGDPVRYRIQWEGYDPDEVDAFGVKSLDLRVGDQVKIDQKGFPKVSHIVRGFKDGSDGPDLAKNLTDIRGYQTLLVAPKRRKSLPADISSESVNEVPVSAIYLDSNMWNQMKGRDYEFRSQPDLSISVLGYATPMERPSTPSTPSSRSRRQVVAQGIPEVLPSTGLFANMAFAISYEDEHRKHSLVALIKESGGKFLRENFMELLEPEKIEARPQFTNIGFTALIADKHSRKEKYMQALALGLPCLSGKWIEACIESDSLVDWQPYLLAAGESEVLEGATKSRIMERMDTGRVKLVDIVQSRSRMLQGGNVIIVMGRGKSEIKRKPYLFLIQALGADGIEKVTDIKAAKDLINGDKSFDWVFVEDSSVEAAKAELLGRDKKKGACKVAGNELVVQSLIMGQLCES